MYVPSLVALCVTVLAPYVDQVHTLPVRLRLRTRRLIDHLVPDHALLDPRLWATIIQVFDSDGLPPAFASHTLPLLHPHQPLLQAIPCSSNFSLITSLFLQGCIHITDATILHLKALHTLTAFDASNTSLTDYAIQTMAATLHFDKDASPRRHSGPWPLRILALRNCKQITNEIFAYLDKFPLLSVLDLRGTLCAPNATKAFVSCSNADLYHPASLSTALATLRDIQPDMYSSSNFYLLNVTTFRPTHRPPQSSIVTPQDAFVVIPSNNTRIKVGNTFILEKQTQEKEDALRHERNKEAWYQRQEILESRRYELEVTMAKREHPKSQQVELNLAAFTAAPAPHRQNRDVPPSQRPSSLEVLPLPPQINQVCKRHRVQAPFPNPKAPTASGITVTRPVQQKARQKTVSDIRPLTMAPRPRSVGANHLAIGTNSTEVPAQPHTSSSAQSGSRLQSFSLPGASTSEEPMVFGTAPTGSGQPRAVVMDVGSLMLETIAPNFGNQSHLTATVVDPPMNNTAQQLNIVSSNGIYEPLPRRTSRPPSLSSTPSGRPTPTDSTKPTPNSRCKDDLLMLYRDPPAWSALNVAVEQRRLEEEIASQHREWRRMRPRNEMAIVDMNSAKAARIKRQLGEFIVQEVTQEQRRVHNSGYESENQPGFLQRTPADPSVGIQPPRSRNPFRKRHSCPANEDPPPTPTAQRPTLSTPEATSTIPLFPVSTIRIPTPPSEVALTRENAGSTGANPKKSKVGNEPRIHEKTKDARRKSTGSGGKTLRASKFCKEKLSADVAFDWKRWGHE